MSANQPTNQPTSSSSTSSSSQPTRERILVGYVRVRGLQGYAPIHMPVFEEDTSVTVYENRGLPTYEIDLSDFFNRDGDSETLGSEDTNETDTTEVSPPSNTRNIRDDETISEYLGTDTGTEVDEQEAQDSDDFDYETSVDDEETEGGVDVTTLPVRRFGSESTFSCSVPIPPPPRGLFVIEDTTPDGLYCNICSERDDYDRLVGREVSFICCNCPQGFCHECAGRMRLTNVCPYCRGNMFLPRNRDNDNEERPSRRRRLN